jgi:hypothetical protein
LNLTARQARIQVFQWAQEKLKDTDSILVDPETSKGNQKKLVSAHGRLTALINRRLAVYVAQEQDPTKRSQGRPAKVQA